MTRSSGPSSWGCSVASEWSAVAPGFLFTWRPERPHIECDDVELVVEVYRLLNGSELLVTPTGPTIRAYVSDPLAARVVLNDLRPQLLYTSGAPPVPSTPEGSTA